MKKLLFILLFSIFTCYKDYKDALSYLEKEGYLEKIKKTFFISGKRAAEEQCIHNLNGDILLPVVGSKSKKKGNNTEIKPPIRLPFVPFESFDKEEDIQPKKPVAIRNDTVLKPPVRLPFVPAELLDIKRKTNPKKSDKTKGNGNILIPPARRLDEDDYELPIIPIKINNKKGKALAKMSNKDICKKIIETFE